MCPIWPFHFLLLYIMLVGPLFLFVCGAAATLSHAAPPLNVQCSPHSVDKITEGDVTRVECQVDKSSLLPEDAYIELTAHDKDIADILGTNKIYFNNTLYNSEKGNFTFHVKGAFLGYTKLNMALVSQGKVVNESDMDVSVIRKKSVLDTVFVSSVATLVSLAYINLGCSSDLEVMKQVIKRPVGPAVGLLCQYVFMPLASNNT